MSIDLDPAELTFQRPFTREVSQTLRIKNNNYDPVAFKVKTTAPKQYCVRPNSGRIESCQEVEVQVLLQAMKADPPADLKCRDKFLVQSVSITADREATNVQQIWLQVERNERAAIHERKIRVVYLPPGDEGSEGTAVPVNSGANAPSHFDSSPPPFVVAQSTPTTAPGGGTTSQREVPSVAAMTPSTHSASEDRESELALAKATIARLEAELQTLQGLRQRKPGAGAAAEAKDRIAGGSTGMGMTAHPPGGIPIHICAALCLFFFFIAWFFF